MRTQDGSQFSYTFFSLGKKFIFYFFMDDDYDEEEDMSALLTVNLIILV